MHSRHEVETSDIKIYTEFLHHIFKLFSHWILGSVYEINLHARFHVLTKHVCIGPYTYVLAIYISLHTSLVLIICCGPSSSVDIVTDYGLDDPGIESRWGEIFRPSRQALGSTQPPVQWAPGLSRG